MTREAFEAARAGNTAELLLRTARLLDEAALARISAMPEAPPVRPAHTRLFPHLDFEGVRATEIADRLGVTKQAVGQLVADLVAWGVVEQVPDPTDGRARLVRYTEQGAQALVHGLSVLTEVEAEVEDRIGPERMAAFKDGLRAYAEVLSKAD